MGLNRSGNDTECREYSGMEALLDAAEKTDLSDSGLFIASGLRAARGTSAAHRRTILTDLANVLQCGPDELDFLFLNPVMAANDSDPVTMPDFRASLNGSLKIALG